MDFQEIVSKCGASQSMKDGKVDAGANGTLQVPHSYTVTWHKYSWLEVGVSDGEYYRPEARLRGVSC